jgi:hypothetical protein
MGDRSYVRITCRREDAEHFQELGFVEDHVESDIALSMWTTKRITHTMPH